MQETQVQSLGREDPLEKEMVTHSSILAWRIPWMEKPSRLLHGVAKSWTRLSDFTLTLSSIFYIFVCQLFLCVLKYIWLLLVEVVDARGWAEKIQDEPAGSCKKGSTQGREGEGNGLFQKAQVPAWKSSQWLNLNNSEVKWSGSVVSDSLQPHGL